jgi:predicted RNA-binding protein with TRAM domain
VLRGASFGAAEVAGAKRFVLRMSAPVKRIEGIPDVGGFTVIVPGSLALDRAGPISATAGNVSRAMILNKGDRAELTVRFAPGQTPRYRVQAQGASLEILIGS